MNKVKNTFLVRMLHIKITPIKLVLSLILIALPFLCAVTLSAIFGEKGSLSFLLPVWDDEIGWYNQVESVIKFGFPIGYNGYNETHAAIGAFGPWGIAPILPYALLGKIFGWNLSSMAVFNLLFLSLSLLIFILLTNPTEKQLVFLIIGFLSLYITIGYSVTSMSESLRYASAIFLTGFIIRAERMTREKQEKFSLKEKLIFIFGSIAALYCVQIYVILSLALFPIAFFALRKTRLKTPLRIIISAALTLLIAALSYALTAAVSSPYFLPGTMEKIFTHIKTEGIFGGLSFAFNSFTINLTNAIFMALGFDRSENNNILFWFFAAYIGLIILLTVWQTVKIFRKKDVKTGENIYLNLALYFLSGFLAAYCLLYTSLPWTLCRGTNTGLTAAVFFLAFCKVNAPRRFQVAIPLLAVVSVFSYYTDTISERQQAADYKEKIIAEKKILGNIMEISPDNSYWENTAAYYGDSDYWTLSLPLGTAINNMANDEKCRKSRYAILTPLKSEKCLPLFEGSDYTLIYSDEHFIIFENKATN